MRFARTLAAIAATSFVVLPALAQEEPAEPAPGDTASPEAAPAGEGEAAPAAEGDPPAAAELPPGQPFPRISDAEETIYAVQRKAYLVDHRFEVSVLGAFSFTDRFVQTAGPAASVTYHLAENFGLQLFGAFLFPSPSGLTRELLEENQLTPEVAKLTQMLWGAALGVEWSPIYGKIELFGASLGNFNLFVGVGGGIGQTRVQCLQAQPIDPNVHGDGATCAESPQGADPFEPVYEPTRTQLMTAFGGGVRFYFANWLGLKLEVKDWLFPARVYRPGATDPTQLFTDAIRNNVFVQLGVSFLFGGED
ncbi:MAG: outer membrane beta-barrel domain-containing protein [Deltaproteobacteria bacterium]|nr:outer membrane beta-barrel domain-containing protein [Deltaproteobacteria bacterium]